MHLPTFYLFSSEIYLFMCYIIAHTHTDGQIDSHRYTHTHTHTKMYSSLCHGLHIVCSQLQVVPAAYILHDIPCQHTLKTKVYSMYNTSGPANIYLKAVGNIDDCSQDIYCAVASWLSLLIQSTIYQPYNNNSMAIQEQCTWSCIPLWDNSRTKLEVCLCMSMVLSSLPRAFWCQAATRSHAQASLCYRKCCDFHGLTSGSICLISVHIRRRLCVRLRVSPSL